MSLKESISETLSDTQCRVVDEIRRIASDLGVDSLSQREFEEHHRIAGVSTAGYQFGSWNEAIVAAGLIPYPSGFSNQGPKLTDNELLRDIIAVHTKIQKRPSERKYSRHGQFSVKPFRDRWGSWISARSAAYSRFGEPSQ